MSNDEDDYMSEKFLEDTTPKQPETYSEKRRRRELEERGRVLPRRVLEYERRKEGLARPLLSADGKLGNNANESPAARMMFKMGYRPGTALGKAGDSGLTEPISVDVKVGKYVLRAAMARKI
jgi:Fe2+ transport system protein FeoA